MGHRLCCGSRARRENVRHLDPLYKMHRSTSRISGKQQTAPKQGSTQHPSKFQLFALQLQVTARATNVAAPDRGFVFPGSMAGTAQLTMQFPSAPGSQ